MFRIGQSMEDIKTENILDKQLLSRYAVLVTVWPIWLVGMMEDHIPSSEKRSYGKFADKS